MIESLYGPWIKAQTGNNAINCPATSSTTTLPGSLAPRIRSVREAAQIPAHVTKTIAANCTGQLGTDKNSATPTNEPNVPGATGR